MVPGGSVQLIKGNGPKHVQTYPENRSPQGEWDDTIGAYEADE
jgi:hypothetical protein